VVPLISSFIKQGDSILIICFLSLSVFFFNIYGSEKSLGDPHLHMYVQCTSYVNMKFLNKW